MKDSTILMRTGLVSICLPTYNGASYIKESLVSVLSQSYSNIEVIITDDNSTDSTLEIAESFYDPRMRIVKNGKGLGLVGNWNRAVSFASGEYIKLMTQDDILCDGAIEKQVEMLEKYPEASLCIGNTSVINADGDTVFKRNRFARDNVLNGKKYAKRSLLGRNLYSEPPNVLYRRADIEKIGLYDPNLSYTPDWDYAIRLSCIGDVAVTSAEIMKFRISDTSETGRLYKLKNLEVLNDSEKLFLKHLKTNELKLTYADFTFFKSVIRAADFARNIVIKHPVSY